MHFPWQEFDDVTLLPFIPAVPRETESGPRRGKKMCLCEFQSAVGSEAKKKEGLRFHEFCVKVPLGSEPSKHFGAEPAANQSPGPAGPQGLKSLPQICWLASEQMGRVGWLMFCINSFAFFPLQPHILR